jgi:hypothetical protein
MNNEVEFAASTHNLLKKMEVGDTIRQARMNLSASTLASPQATRKKKFTKLDLARMLSSQETKLAISHTDRKEAGEVQNPPPREENTHLGSISQPAARSKLTYD